MECIFWKRGKLLKVYHSNDLFNDPDYDFEGTAREDEQNYSMELRY